MAAVSFTERILAYHDERWRALYPLLRSAWQQGDGYSIHGSRVEIEKITALCEFIHFSEPAADVHSELKPIRHIFKLLGQIRDLHRAMDLCEEFKIDESLCEQHQSMKRIRHKIKAQYAKHKDQLRKIRKRNTKRLLQTNAVTLRTYLHEQQTELSTLLSVHPSLQALHETRKYIKYLLYTAALAPAQRVVSKADMTRLDKLQDQIGDWHDLCLFIERLKKCGYDEKQPETYARIVAKADQMSKKFK